MQTHRAPLTGRNNAQTSYTAADVIAGSAPTLRSQVLNYAAGRRENGFTDEELAEYFEGMTVNSIRPRRVELKDDGLIVASKLRRKNSRGNDCVVWMHIACAQGAQAVAPKPKYSDLVRLLDIERAANRGLQARIRTLERALASAGCGF